MTKIAYLAPKKEMLEHAKVIMAEQGMEMHLEAVATKDAVAKAREMVDAGTEIIIARGYQAHLIRRYLDIPVVDVRMTAQEMGMLIVRAKLITNLPCPIIGVIGSSRLFCDMSYFDRIYGIHLKQYFIDNTDSYDDAIREQVEKAVIDRIDLLIGGDVAQHYAQKAGLNSLFLSSTEDSIREAFREARNVMYAKELEQRNTAEFETLLDYSFHTIVKLDTQGRIVIVNQLAQQLLGWEPAKVVNRYLLEVTDAISKPMLENVLRYGNEIYSTFIRINNSSFVANLAPILSDNQIMGAVFSCQEVKQLEKMEGTVRKELYRQGHVAKCNFSVFDPPSKAMQSVIKQAKLYAQSDAPVLIFGETGPEQDMLAQSIHNESGRKGCAFISLDCDSSNPMGYFTGPEDERAARSQFGKLVSMAHGGSLYLRNLERLSCDNQLLLLDIITNRVLTFHGTEAPLAVDVKIIASCDRDLVSFVKNGKFRSDLYYAVNVLGLSVPGLCDRPQDILYFAEYFIRQYMDKYNRYLVLDDRAKKALQEYFWPGNLQQLKSFCERLVLTTKRRTIREDAVESLLTQMYPFAQSEDAQPTVIYRHPEAARIAELLVKHGGKRKAVAEEMGIAPSTLWRKIKKHRIQDFMEI